MSSNTLGLWQHYLQYFNMQALKTTYHLTKQYMEIDIDVSANSTAAYITGMVRGATSSLVIDLGEAAISDPFCLSVN